jgi:transcription elongation factor GreA
MPDAIVMTPAGLAALKAELERLETVARREIAERIRVAREWGDLSENAEYHDAKNDQAHLETRIKRLREQLMAAEVRDAPAPTDVVGFGSRVEVEDADSGRHQTYTLVSATESDPGAGRLSIASPVGRALEGARPGDTVRAPTPRGERRLKVLAIGEPSA